jgi:hypothetical protein
VSSGFEAAVSGIFDDIIQALVQEPSISTFTSPEKSLKPKIQPDGHQPFELQRSNSLQYSMFNLYGLFRLADIGKNIGIDVWDYGSPDKPLLQKALDFLLPYITKLRDGLILKLPLLVVI